MTLEAEKAYDGMELLDLLFDQNDGILRHEGFGQHNCPSWPTTEHSLLSPAEGSDEFLSALLSGSDSVSGSPLWSPAASDSGISEDPQSDQLDSPPPCRPPDSPHLKPPYPPVAPTSQHPPPALPLDSQEPDVSIDLGGWESGFFVERPSNGSHLGEDQKAHGIQRIQMLSNFPLTVKDLLLSSSSEPPQQQSQQPFQELVLNEDEKKLLAKEGVSLPSQLPLTKYEERILKKIRRKIRNKQSAQESRKKKKEYIDGLESRMAACSAQNQELQRKVFQLEKRNSSLMEQLRRLQTLVMSSSNKTAQTGTCIMVLLLSFSLILFPCLRPFSGSTVSQEGDFSPVRVQSRSLHDVESSRVSHAVAHDRAHSAPEPGRAAPKPSGEEGGKVMSLFGKLSQGNGLPFADFASAHVNHTHDVEERGHHQGDPITGHVATVSWTEHHGGKTPLPNHADEM